MKTKLVLPLTCLALSLALGAFACSDNGEEEVDDVGVDTDSPPEDAAPAEDAPSGPFPAVVSPSLWSQIDAEDDPLEDHRPAEVDCPADAIKTEVLDGDSSYAVDMENCNYLAVSQPSLTDIEEGDTLRARIWHFTLTPPPGEDSAEAHAAILFNGQIAWESTVEIPADGQLLSPEWEAEQDYPVGTDVVFHLHNHGDNQWNFIELSRIRN